MGISGQPYLLPRQLHPNVQKQPVSTFLNRIGCICVNGMCAVGTLGYLIQPDLLHTAALRTAGVFRGGSKSKYRKYHDCGIKQIPPHTPGGKAKTYHQQNSGNQVIGKRDLSCFIYCHKHASQKNHYILASTNDLPRRTV